MYEPNVFEGLLSDQYFSISPAPTEAARWQEHDGVFYNIGPTPTFPSYQGSWYKL